MWANGMQTTTLKAFDYAAGSFSAQPTAYAVCRAPSCLVMRSSLPESHT